MTENAYEDCQLPKKFQHVKVAQMMGQLAVTQIGESRSQTEQG